MEFLLRHKVLNIVLFALTIFIYIGFTRPVDGNKLVDKNGCVTMRIGEDGEDFKVQVKDPDKND